MPVTTDTLAREATNPRWVPVALFIAIVYPLVGVAFAALDKVSTPAPIHLWRLAAWLVSAAAFGAHLAYEHLRLRASNIRAALHTSIAVGAGAFVLAVWVNVHGRSVAASHQSPLAPLALILFPLLTAVPAFLVALLAGAVLIKMRRQRQ